MATQLLQKIDALEAKINTSPECFVYKKKGFQQEVSNGYTIDHTNYRFQPVDSKSTLDKFSVGSYQLFKHNALPIEGAQVPFHGVCDLEYAYHIVSLSYSLDPTTMNAQGGEMSGIWRTIFQNSPGPRGTSLFVKQDRKTGEIVSVVPMGQVTGVSTTDIESWTGLGDDIARGPLHMHGDYLYVIGDGSKYHSVTKMTKDFKKVWRVLTRPVSLTAPEINSNNPNLRTASYLNRTLTVIPAKPGAPTTDIRSKPMVIVGVTAGWEYPAITLDTFEKLFNYYTSTGHLMAYTDNGSSATLAWDFATAPATFKGGEKLSKDSFARNDDRSLQNECRIYYPLKHGFTFSDGSANSTTGYMANGTTPAEKTSGRYDFVIKNDAPDKDYGWLTGSYTFASGDVFDISGTYTVKRTSLNKVSGRYDYVDASFNFVSDGSAATVDISGNQMVGQPIVKILYKSQIGVKKLDADEAYNLNYYGPGIYGGITYDPETDSVIYGTGNNSGYPHDDEYRMYKNLRPNALNPLTYGWPAFLKESNVVDGSKNGVSLSGQTSFKRMADGELAAKQYYNEQTRIMWQKIDNVHKLGFSDRYHRNVSDCIVSNSVATGKLNWAFKSQPVDITDHSITIGTTGAKAFVYHPNGPNNDCAIGAVIANIPDNSGNLRKFICCANKSRCFILDYTKMNSLDVSSATTDSTGIKSGVVYPYNTEYCKYRDMLRPHDGFQALAGIAYDPNNHIFVLKGNSNSQVYGVVFGAKTDGFQWQDQNKTPYQPNGINITVEGHQPVIFGYNAKSIVNGTDLSGNESTNNVDCWAYCLDNSFPGEINSCGLMVQGGLLGFNMVLVSDKGGPLTMLNSTDGHLIHRLPMYASSAIPPIVADGIIYTLSSNERWAYQPANGGRTQLKNNNELLMFTPYGV